MVAITSFADDTRSRVAKVEGHRPSLSIRASSMVFGFAFIWAGAGLWLMPGLDMTPYVLLAKMGVSILMVTAGVGMTQIATDKPRKELHFDERNKQLLVYEGLPRARKHILQAIQYDEIGRVNVSDRKLEVSDMDGNVLVTLPISGGHARLDAIAQLRSQSIFPS